MGLEFEDMFKPQNEARSRRARRDLRKAIEDMDYRDVQQWNRLQEQQQKAVNDTEFGVTNAINTDRKFSPAVWKDCPFETIKSRGGIAIWDDFTVVGNAVMSSAYTASIGAWSAYGYAGATITDGQKEGGVLQLQSNDDQEGIALFSSTGSIRLVTTSTLLANQKTWYESRWARSTVTTVKTDIFVGLMAPTLSSGLPAAAQPITTTDDTLMTAGDLFGFHSNSTSAVRGGMTEIASAFVLASGTVNYPTNQTTMMASSGNSVLTAGGYVKTGFVFDMNGPRKRITAATARQTAGTVRRAMVRFFINNMELPSFLTSDDCLNATATQAFPTAFMTPVFAVMNTASAGGRLDIDWVRVAQEPNS